MEGPNWGIIGTGFIAGQFAKDFAHVKDGRIRAVASRSQDKADSFAKEYGIDKAYEGYGNLLEDGDVNAVYIATPHNLHYENTLEAIKNKKVVLCEKPAAVNTSQLKEMIDQSRKHGVLFMEAMWTYFMPAVVEAKRWIASGEVGEVNLIQADFGEWMNFPPEHRINNPHLAGGGLLDLGIYPVAIANLMIDDEIQDIQAMTRFGETRVDEITAVNLKYKNGIIAQLISSTKNTTANEARIFGTKGHICIPKYWKAGKANLTTPQKEVAFQDTREALGFNYEIEEMNKLIKQDKKESNVVTFARSLKNMEILDEIRRQIGLKYPFE